MAPTLQLVYPVTLPRVYGNEIKYEDLIASEPLEKDLRAMSVRRVEFIEQLNTSEISAPNLKNIAQSGLSYLAYLHTLVEGCTSMQAHVPFFSWRSGVNSAAPAIQHGCESIKQALNYEICMVMATIGSSLTAYASFLIDFDEDNIVDEATLANATKALGQAAGIYAYAHENIASRVCDLLKTPSELPELQPKALKGLSLYCCLCLQQVAYESARTTMSHPLLAKICKQVADYAKQVQEYIPQEYGFTGVFSHLTPTSHLYSTMAYGHMAKDEWAKDNWGVAIAYGKVAKEHLAKLRAFEAKLSSPILRSVITREADPLTEILAEYENDNSNVYFQREPPAIDLPLIRGVAVKAPTPYVPECQPEMVALISKLNEY